MRRAPLRVLANWLVAVAFLVFVMVVVVPVVIFIFMDAFASKVLGPLLDILVLF